MNETRPPATNAKGNSSADSSAELRSMLAGEVLALYQKNPFRLLGIATDCTTQQAQKRAQKLTVWRQMGETVADEFAVRDALQTLRDPQKRLVAELFWFHTDAYDPPDSSNALALAKLKSGHWPEARDLWREEASTRSGEESGWRALHNLAVLLHARMVTFEVGKNPLIQTLGGNVPLSAQYLKEWHESLEAWRGYLACDDAWKHWKARAFDIGDKRLDQQFVPQLRSLLPDALLQINRDLARRYADKQYGFAAGAHCKLMLESKLGDETARAFCRTVLDPMRKRVLETCDKFKERIENEDSVAKWNSSKRFADAMQQASALLVQIDPKKKFGAVAARESIAQALKSVALSCTSTKHFSHCASILNLALTFTDSVSLQTDLKETREQANYLAEVWRKATPKCLLCARRPDDWTTFTQRNTGQQRLVFLCGSHADDSDQKMQQLIYREVEARWNMLPAPPPDSRK